jgi:[glutamine synthetase] adenylyltransferase / [glutamine synthetase]-adenylyl-L-tyrosine phosphorylase
MTEPAAIPLAARFASGPAVSAAEDADRRVAQWLDGVATPQREAILAILDRHPLARAIVAGIADASPYLFDLLRGNPERAHRILTCDAERHLTDLIDNIHSAAAVALNESELMRLLRSIKAEAALLIALCDIGGIWSIMRVTEALTELAIASVQSAVRFQLAQETARGRLIAPDTGHPEVGCGLIVLAMGKMGAGELNYSSDIDLIVLFDRERSALKGDIEPQTFFVRIAQGVARILQQRTGDGYVFRVDLRLRPDPSSTPVAVSTEFALGYYEREGRTWERAAMIKASPCAGDLAAGEVLMAELAPFVWRRHLDFTALGDIHEMKRQMHAFRGHSDVAVEGHNIKQGRGGIREIEFFVQTQQLIAGGRHPELRVRPTLRALDLLADGGWIAREVRDDLTTAYEFLRRVEHRLQMVDDEQTHTLPDDAAAMERFARFLGFADRDAFAAELEQHLRRVQTHYSQLFEGETARAPGLPAPDFTRGPNDPALVEQLASVGFKQPLAAADILKNWVTGTYRNLRAEQTLSTLAELIPALIADFGHSENPDAALVQFDHFLQSLRRGGRLISLLHQNRSLVALLALILGAAPRLGETIARQPQVVDGLVDPRFFGAMPKRDEIARRLEALLADASTYEDFLDRVRLFGQEGLFLIGTRILSGTVSAQLAGAAFADIAEGIVRAIHRLVVEQFITQYGEIRGQRTAILAMGRLGSREMTASSDLDLILIYDFDHDHPDSSGPKSLNGAQYFARLTQRLIGAFTARTNYGVLYEIDMRLRPSGRSGPVASRLDAFAHYQDNEAWTWEHMALTRARVISGAPDFAGEIDAIIRNVLMRRRDRELIANDVLEMRQAIADEKGENDIWDLKYAAGGMMDIEFVAQFLQLVHAADNPDILDKSTQQVLERAARFGLLAQGDADVLRPAARLYQDLGQILRLCLNERFRPEASGADLMNLLARAADEPDFSTLEARVKDTQTEVRRIFSRILGAGPARGAT